MQNAEERNTKEYTLYCYECYILNAKSIALISISP